MKAWCLRSRCVLLLLCWVLVPEVAGVAMLGIVIEAYGRGDVEEITVDNIRAF